MPSGVCSYSVADCFGLVRADASVTTLTKRVYPDKDVADASVLSWALAILAVLTNIYGLRAIPRLNTFTGIVSILVTLVVVILLFVRSAGNFNSGESASGRTSSPFLRLRKSIPSQASLFSPSSSIGLATRRTELSLSLGEQP